MAAVGVCERRGAPSGKPRWDAECNEGSPSEAVPCMERGTEDSVSYPGMAASSSGPRLSFIGENELFRVLKAVNSGAATAQVCSERTPRLGGGVLLLCGVLRKASRELDLNQACTPKLPMFVPFRKSFTSIL